MGVVLEDTGTGKREDFEAPIRRVGVPVRDLTTRGLDDAEIVGLAVVRHRRESEQLLLGN